MTRAEKLKKLGNAVKEWRGMSANGKWLIRPNENAVFRVDRWLKELGFTDDIKRADTVSMLSEFKKWEDYYAWIKTL